MDIKCKVCGEQMNLIPPGISKRTGEAYEAFYSCPNRCKQGKTAKGTNDITDSKEVEGLRALWRKDVEIIEKLSNIEMVLTDILSVLKDYTKPEEIFSK
jgi:hypothetical protein